MKSIHLAGGSFWDLQRYFDCVAGVMETQAGFANGNIMHPSYMEVCTGKTGFAEVVLVRFDDKLLPLSSILELYLKALEPIKVSTLPFSTEPQHRSGIYYRIAEDRDIIISYLEAKKKRYPQATVIEVAPLTNYYPAEEYHQHYLEKNPSGYRRIGREAFKYAGQYRV